MKTKLMKAFTTATAVVCLFGGGLNIEAKNISDSDYFKSKDVHLEKSYGRYHVVNNNGTELFITTKKDEYKYISDVYVNIRKTPTTKYKPIKTMHIGQRVHVIGRNVVTGWSIIELDDCESEYAYGFVRSKYLCNDCPVEYVDKCKLTWYCNCSECSEGWGTQTSTGNETIEGYTVAADPNFLSYGTRIFIKGYGEFVVDDTGGALIGTNTIDIYENCHSATEYNGVDYKDVYIIKE